MTTYGTILPGAISLARWAQKVESLTPKARHRLKILDWHRNHSNNISLTARHFGLSRYTIRAWLKRFKQCGVVGLNDRSKRPKNTRQPTTDSKIVIEIIKTRKQYPAWSKYKIKTLLAQKGIQISNSTVGRVIKRHGLVDKRISQKRSRAARFPKARFPRGLKISNPGDFVQMDTKHINLPGGRKLYQFTAIDVLTKHRILDVYPSESSRHGANFLCRCLEDFPFHIKAIQTDNGAPFLKNFEIACKEKSIPHYFIYPRTPKQNTYVEISHGADKREFYLQGNIYQNIDMMRKKLQEWQCVWNEIRPHQALNYLTPKAYLEKWQNGRLPTKDVITLQT